jgi:hypothetical protein
MHAIWLATDDHVSNSQCQTELPVKMPELLAPNGNNSGMLSINAQAKIDGEILENEIVGV